MSTLTKRDVTMLVSALKAKLKAAKAGAVGMKAKLRSAFEIELNTYYPCQTDEVWQKQFDILDRCHRECQKRVDKRCDEMGIPRRFWPSLQIGWRMGGIQLIKELRADMRRTAYAQIDAMITEQFEEMDRTGANMQLEIIAAGKLTEIARAFLESIARIEERFTPISAKSVFKMMEGQWHGEDPLRQLYSRYGREKLPEYQPDLGIKDEEEE